jgi:antitoxin (DNA-binding transcriptional repressor) of toxin-antitoxin stability system
VKTISVRDLRQRWPAAEALLQVEKEILITRDAKPVAKLVRITEQPKARKRFDPVAHARWQKRTAHGKVSELEAAIQLRAGWLSGEYGQARYRAYMGRLNTFRDTDPFRFRSLPGSVFSVALRQAARHTGSIAAPWIGSTWRPWRSWGCGD